MRYLDLAKPEAWQEFRSTGFLRISNVIGPKKVAALRKEAYRVFHNTGLIDSNAYRVSGRSGFTPPGIEGVAGRRADFGRQFWDAHLDTESERTVCEHTRGLASLMRHMTVELSDVMSGVFSYMDRGLGPLAHGLHAVMLKGNHGLRATHYPASTITADGILFPSHRDFSLVTVFIGGSESGLQIDQAGCWQAVDNPAGDITIIAGGMLRYWTGGPKHPHRIGGLRHRVMRDSVERLSLSFFTEPEPHTVLPYSNGMTAGEYITSFVTATRAAS